MQGFSGIIDENALSPMMRQYIKVKKQYRYGKVYITFYVRKGALDE